MNVLVVGARGMLGSELLASAPAGFQVTGVDIQEVDITDRGSVARCFDEHAPELVFNAAAYTAVDKAEEQVELAHRVNAIGPQILGLEARKRGVRIQHVSTDFVFDGLKGEAYAEYDAPNPLSVYGASKLWGELLLRDTGADYQVVRTQWLYGPRGAHFVRTILKAAKERPELRVVDDQFGSPTCTLDLAPAMWHIAQHGGPGIWHASNDGRTSWFAFTQAILAAASIGTPVEPMSSIELDRPARRPTDSTLANLRLGVELGHSMRPWREVLQQYVREGDVLDAQNG